MSISELKIKVFGQDNFMLLVENWKEFRLAYALQNCLLKESVMPIFAVLVFAQNASCNLSTYPYIVRNPAVLGA